MIRCLIKGNLDFRMMECLQDISIRLEDGLQQKFNQFCEILPDSVTFISEITNLKMSAWGNAFVTVDASNFCWIPLFAFIFSS